MKRLASYKSLFLALCCSQLSAIAACPPSITTQYIRKSMYSRYEALIGNERKLGNLLVPKQLVDWQFEGKSGQFLLAEVQNKQIHSCAVYIARDGKFLPLGGNNHCSWARSSQLVHQGKKSWIEFRQHIEQPVNDPVPINEFTAHFQKDTGGLCILGLPVGSYESLRCSEDEAPDSQ